MVLCFEPRITNTLRVKNSWLAMGMDFSIISPDDKIGLEVTSHKPAHTLTHDIRCPQKTPLP